MEVFSRVFSQKHPTPSPLGFHHTSGLSSLLAQIERVDWEATRWRRLYHSKCRGKRNTRWRLRRHLINALVEPFRWYFQASGRKRFHWFSEILYLGSEQDETIMNRKESPRDDVLNASRAYYAHRAYYEDLLDQGASSRAKTRRELDFLESVFRADATLRINDVLDVACGNGRHIIGLAGRGFRCTGLDYTPERVQVAKARAHLEGVSVKLSQGDATKLAFESEFDAALALYILFLLPDDDDVLKCLRQIYRSLRSGGVMVCNVFNPLSERAHARLQGSHVSETRAPGIRCLDTDRFEDFDQVRGVTWWEETSVIEAPDGTHVFRDHERMRLFTYWDILHYLQIAGFKEIKCYPDWKIESSRKPKADWLVFVARKT